MAVWDPFLTEQGRKHSEMWGKTQLTGLGDKPALVGFPTQSHWGRGSTLGAASEAARQRLTPDEASMANEIVAEIAPLPGEFVGQRAAAGACHGTPLLFHLNAQRVDTPIVCGETTSGCVRATVVDGATFRYRVGIVEECCFDRTQASHAINLFDMDQKYADIVDSDVVNGYFARIKIRSLPA